MHSDFAHSVGPNPGKELTRSGGTADATHKRRAHRGGEAKAEEPKDRFQSTKGAEVEAKAEEPKVPTVKISYLPQDPGMLPPGTVEVPASDIQAGPSNSRLKMSESPQFPPAKPDADGNLIFDLEDPRFDAAQTFVIADRSLKMAEKYLGRELPWAFTKELERNELIIHPHLGANTPNAFYSSQAGSVNFFHFIDPVTKETIRTGQSADVVAHEVGHALLDAIRHEYISSLSIHGGGFHEAFGDMTAMLTALQDEAVIEAVHAETQGDLTRPNVVSRAAEGLGQAIGHLTDKKMDALRSGLNNFHYADQHFLPYLDRERGDSVLSQESHSYSNLFTGAFYDLLTELTNVASSSERSFGDALKFARDVSGTLLFRAAELGPVGDPSVREMALAFLTADEIEFGGQFRPVLEAVFGSRGILRQEDVEAFDKARAELPDVKLENPPADKASAEAFLKDKAKDLRVPDRPYEFLEKRTNEDGETILLYKFERNFPIEGAEFGSLEGSKAQAIGGLTLSFDGEGKLQALCVDDVTDREVEDIRYHLKRAVGEGMLVAQGLTPDASATDAQKMLHSLHLAKVATPDGYVLRRAPEIWG